MNVLNSRGILSQLLQKRVFTLAVLVMGFGVFPSVVVRGADDPVKSNCSALHPLQFKNDIYYIDVIVKGEDNQPHPFTFLFDTGYSESSLSPQACKIVSCKVVGQRKINPITDFEIKELSPVVVTVGGREFKLPRPSLDDTGTLYAIHADGVIGGDVIFNSEIIVNLKSQYLCFPKSPIDQLAEKLSLEKVDAVYDAGRVWVSFSADERKIDDYFLDTGSDTTSLLPKDIEMLTLNKLKEEVRNASEHGFHNVRDYGPVSIEFAGLRQKLGAIAVSSDSQMRKLGTDVLHSYIFGFHPGTSYVFVGH